jgi:hypothetical protein
MMADGGAQKYISAIPRQDTQHKFYIWVLDLHKN